LESETTAVVNNDNDEIFGPSKGIFLIQYGDQIIELVHDENKPFNIFNYKEDTFVKLTKFDANSLQDEYIKEFKLERNFKIRFDLRRLRFAFDTNPQVTIEYNKKKGVSESILTFDTSNIKNSNFTPLKI